MKNLSSEGEVLADVFTIQNNAEGFDTLLQTIRRCTSPESKIKVGLEATGHYSYNILGFLLNEGLPTYLINPLHTNLYRKSLSLRETKTDRVDARTIAASSTSSNDAPVWQNGTPQSIHWPDCRQRFRSDSGSSTGA